LRLDLSEKRPHHHARAIRQIRVVDTHTAGEPTRIALAGIPRLKGRTLLSRREHFRTEFDELRQALLWEPRGHRDMFGAILIKPTNGADLATFFMDAGGYVNMCIHGSIGVLTAALELGLVRPRGANARYTLETPAGVLPLIAKLRNGRAEEVTVRNVPSFLWLREAPLEVPSIGSIRMDVAYAGNWFALVSAADLGVDLGRTPLGTVLEIGRRVLVEARERIALAGSIAPPPHQIGLLEIYDAVQKPHTGKKHRNIVIFGNGQYDRSPCGTGTCARMAALHARGELALGETFLSESVTGGIFKGRLLSRTARGEIVTVVPEVTGTAFVTGIGRLVLDADDPLGYGFIAPLD
jgi:proline racemase